MFYCRFRVFLVLLVALMLSPALLGSEPSAQTASGDVFLEKPYLQLGNEAQSSGSERLALLWHTNDEVGDWSVETQDENASRWKKADKPVSRPIAIPGIAPHRLWTVILSGLKPGKPFRYRVLKDGVPVFTATATARKTEKQPYRFVVFGDCSQNTPGQKAVAYQTYLARPDFVFITGDIVYGSGRISEYREKYFPIYNADNPAADTGAPLLRSTVFLSSPGNHDILNANLEKTPDTMAYFYYWAQPLNGPELHEGGANVNTLIGPEQNRKAFRDASGAQYPRMANFSFDYGNAHWTVLDANGYVDWTDPDLRAWVERDLASASKATWRFVAFHQPGFNSSKNHFSEQRMRLMADVFEKGKVDIVFTGHVHNYQRSFPMTFAVDKAVYAAAHAAPRQVGEIGGQWTLDKSFDGQTNTRPKGVIYIVTGAGGAGLYNPEQQDKPDSWQPFTHKYIADTHSMTLVDVNGKTLTLRQVAEDGKELDRITVTK